MCELYEGDFEDCEVARQTRHRARKAYRCDCCDTTIQPGDEYVRYVWISRGRLETECECLACHDVNERFCAEHTWGWLSPSTLEWHVVECIYEDRWVAEAEGIRARRAAARAENATSVPSRERDG